MDFKRLSKCSMKKLLSNLISEEDYWEVIGESLKNRSSSILEQHDALCRIFSRKTIEQLIGICYHGTELYRKAYTSNLWAAAYIVRGGCGDSSFHYFRCWLAIRNRDTYYSALKNPDSLITEFSSCKKSDDILYDHIAVLVNDFYSENHPSKTELFTIMEENYEVDHVAKDEMEMSALIEFNWDENDPASLRKICPNLYDKYWDNPLE